MLLCCTYKHNIPDFEMNFKHDFGNWLKYLIDLKSTVSFSLYMYAHVHVTHFNGYQALTMGKFLFPRYYSTPFTEGERWSQQMVEKKGVVLDICMLCPKKTLQLT